MVTHLKEDIVRREGTFGLVGRLPPPALLLLCAAGSLLRRLDIGRRLRRRLLHWCYPRHGLGMQRLGGCWCQRSYGRCGRLLQYALRHIHGQMCLGRANLLSNLTMKEGLDEGGETLIGMHACTLCGRRRWLRLSLTLLRLRPRHEGDGLLKASEVVGQCLRGCGQGGRRLIVRRRRRRFLLLTTVLMFGAQRGHSHTTHAVVMKEEIFFESRERIVAGRTGWVRGGEGSWCKAITAGRREGAAAATGHHRAMSRASLSNLRRRIVVKGRMHVVGADLPHSVGHEISQLATSRGFGVVVCTCSCCRGRVSPLLFSFFVSVSPGRNNNNNIKR